MDQRDGSVIKVLAHKPDDLSSISGATNCPVANVCPTQRHQEYMEFKQ